jgi:hypothetical protein
LPPRRSIAGQICIVPGLRRTANGWETKNIPHANCVCKSLPLVSTGAIEDDRL